MKQAHTQTEKYNQSYNTDNGDVVVRRSDGLIVATFTHDSDDSWASKYTKQDAEKNAKTFVASVDLLEALQDALNIIDRLCEEYADATDKHASYTQGEHKKLTNAIKKATT
jgi:hypothetical protein